MRRDHCILLVVLALALAGCIPPTTPEGLIETGQAGGSTELDPTATPRLIEREASCEVVKCPCTDPILVEAWIDRNENGIRDPEDEPFQGVRFQLRWLEQTDSCSTPHWTSQYLVTDATGHDFFALSDCGCGTEEIEPETPIGHKLTTPNVIGCLFDAPSSYGNYTMNTLMTAEYCRSYGFTPISP